MNHSVEDRVPLDWAKFGVPGKLMDKITIGERYQPFCQCATGLEPLTKKPTKQDICFFKLSLYRLIAHINSFIPVQMWRRSLRRVKQPAQAKHRVGGSEPQLSPVWFQSYFVSTWLHCFQQSRIIKEVLQRTNHFQTRKLSSETWSNLFKVAQLITRIPIDLLPEWGDLSCHKLLRTSYQRNWECQMECVETRRDKGALREKELCRMSTFHFP